ncbi:MAG: SdrD B-like domain-containing protein, partial [Verrucomicrobiota bacterium]
EFYDDGWSIASGGGNSNDAGAGGLGLLPGTNDVLFATSDTLSAYSAGVIYFDTTNGDRLAGQEVFQSSADPADGTFAKAGGLGDLEIVCPPTNEPVEIGNRVWEDSDGDGVQDPDEAGISGVSVSLDIGGMVVMTTTQADDPSTPQDETGQYLFSGAAGENADGLLMAGSMGIISISLSDPNVPGNLTAGMGATNDQHDSDAAESGGNAVINFTAPSKGADHSFDFGFLPASYDLALTKMLAPGQSANISPGDDVRFRIEITNQDADADQIVITDYLPSTGFSFDSSKNTYAALYGVVPAPSISHTDWALVSGNPTATVDGGTLATSGTTYLDLVLTASLSITSGAYFNYAEISQFEDTNMNVVSDTDSFPDTNPANDSGGGPGVLNQDDYHLGGGPAAGEDEDDHDPALVFVQSTTAPVFDLALRKTTTASSVRPGEDVIFTIEVINQGTIDASDFTVREEIPAGFVFDDSKNAAWTGAFGATNPTYVFSGTLLPGDSHLISIILTVSSSATAGNLTNYAEISAADDDGNSGNTPPIDEDSTPGSGTDPDETDDEITGGGPSANTDEDDRDPETVVVETFDLALTKVYTSENSADGNIGDGLIRPGDNVLFTITVTNQGQVTATDIDIVDYIPAGFVLNDSNWTAFGSNQAVRTIAGPLAPTNSTPVTITLQATTSAANGTLTNYAEIGEAEDGNGMLAMDVDSTPDMIVFIGHRSRIRHSARSIPADGIISRAARSSPGIVGVVHVG